MADNEELRAGDLVTADESGKVRRARPGEYGGGIVFAETASGDFGPVLIGTVPAVPTYSLDDVVIMLGGRALPDPEIGMDWRSLDRVAADSFGLSRNPFSRSTATTDVVNAAEAIGLRITATAALPNPPDGRVLVTVRCESRPLRWGELRQIREALQQRGVAGIWVVVRDGAQLDGMRDRALAPFADPPPRPTADAMRERLARSMATPKLPLP